MPLKDDRARTVIDGGKDQGRRTVSYRNANGRTQNATVLGAGTVSGLKLAIRNGGVVRIVDNVPKATTAKSTVAYFSRIGN